MQESWDVVIVGGGNAALSAAHAARERAERVLVLEKAPREWVGGNSYFTAGAFRTTFSVTLPSSTCATGPRPCVPMTMRSTWCACA